jgi:rhodanese-related sulfurtransferase
MSCAAIRWIAAACLPAVLSCSGPTAAGAAHPPARTPPATSTQTAGTPATPAPTPGNVTRIQLDAFFPLQQAATALIYDVRPGFSFRRGHIPHAISWPKSQFTTQLAAREAEMRAAHAARRPVIFYCTDLACPDSNKIATRLAARGHSVSILDGGYAAWISAELPSE